MDEKPGGSWWDKVKEWVHGALDIAGLVPGLGEIADGANALIYLAEGRFIEAGISAVAMIPILGDVGKVGKWGAKAGKELLEEGAERLVKEGAESLVERTAKEGADNFLNYDVLLKDSPYSLSYRGSTANLAKGTTLPRNLREQLAIEQVMTNPLFGIRLDVTMTDSRWLASEGWEKMQQIIKSGGEPINVHYLFNQTTHQIDDFKIVLPGRRPSAR